MMCDFEKAEPGIVRCRRCTNYAYADDPCRVRATCKVRGLGDRIADGLAAVGITKERYQRLRGKPCGCEERQETLNRWWERINRRVRGRRARRTRSR